MWAQGTQYGFPRPKLNRPCRACPASEISKISGSATCIHGPDFAFCSFVLFSTQLLWLMKACLAYAERLLLILTVRT